MNPHQSARAASMGRTGRLSGRRVHRPAVPAGARNERSVTDLTCRAAFVASV